MRTWREMRAAWAVLSLGLGVVAGFAVTYFWPTASMARVASLALLWIGMLVPVVLAFVASRPIGLLRFRAIDLLFGLALGLLLRLAQGWAAQMSDAGAAFPATAAFDGQIPQSWWWTQALPAVVGAPLVEELFFRALLLVCVYTALRRGFGHVTAGLAAVLVSTALFIVLHAIGGTMTADAVVAYGLVGATCALLVLLTGRIWAAVLVHAVYNLTGLALTVAGTLLG